MYKNGVLTISDWQNGMAKHPIYGFGRLKNVEVFENLGIAKLKNRAIDSGASYNALPSAEIYDIYGNTYTLEGQTGLGTGRVLKNGTEIITGLTKVWDIKIYKDYLWVSYSSSLACYGLLNHSPQELTLSGIPTFNTVSSGQLLVGQDDYLYRLSGNTVYKLEVTPAVAGVAPTVTNSATLDLKDGQYGVCMEEYGTYLAIGTTSSSSYSTRNNFPGARLYLWNRQAGTLGNPGLADLPVVFNENGVNSIIQYQNRLYISAGSNGNIYVSDGTNYSSITQIPYTKSGMYYPNTVYLNSMSISPRGTLLVGVSGEEGQESKLFATSPGIYEIDLNNKNQTSYFIAPSVTAGNNIGIGFINSKTSQVLRYGYQDSSTYGVALTETVMYTNYGGVIESPLVKVGVFNNKKTFERIEFYLSSPLVSGQNIRISYRLNDTDSYTTLGTWGFDTIGAKVSWEDKAPIANAEFVQLKIELDQATSTNYGSNINLVAVTLK